MKTLDGLVQGEPAWHAARGNNRRGASEASAMMGDGCISRDELLRQKFTGVVPDIPDYLLKLFADGHKAEAAARPIMQKHELIGEELYAITAVHDEYDFLLASFDGLTIMNDVVWEHKLWNARLAERVRNNDLDPKYYWQLEQQLLVSGASRVVFTTSDGTADKMESMEYYPVTGRAEALIAGWIQFNKDLETYETPEHVVEIVAETIESLPSVFVNVAGDLAVKSNLEEFELRAKQIIATIPDTLETDQDFSNAKEMAKFCRSTAKNLNSVKANMRGQVVDLDAAFNSIERVQKDFNANALRLEKDVKRQDQAIREKIVSEAGVLYRKHVESLANRISHVVRIPDIQVNFSGAIKGKRKIESLRNAVNTELARCKIAANEAVDLIDQNIKTMLTHAPEHRFLFSDLQQTCTKAPDDFLAMIKLRIAEHKQAEEAKLKAERERVQAETDAKVRAEAVEKSEQAESEPEPEKQAISTVVSMPSKAAPAKTAPKTLMEDIASWCDAWRIPAEASAGLCEIIEGHMYKEEVRRLNTEQTQEQM